MPTYSGPANPRERIAQNIETLFADLVASEPVGPVLKRVREVRKDARAKPSHTDDLEAVARDTGATIVDRVDAIDRLADILGRVLSDE